MCYLTWNFLQGVRVSEEPWYNLSRQSLQPLFISSSQLVLPEGGPELIEEGSFRASDASIQARISMETAFNGGSSMKFTGGVGWGGVLRCSTVSRRGGSMSEVAVLCCVGGGGGGWEGIS